MGRYEEDNFKYWSTRVYCPLCLNLIEYQHNDKSTHCSTCNQTIEIELPQFFNGILKCKCGTEIKYTPQYTSHTCFVCKKVFVHRNLADGMIFNGQNWEYPNKKGGFMWFGKRKSVGKQIDKITEEYLQLQGEKRKLEISIDSLKLDLQNKQREQEMALQRAKHEHELKLATAKAELDRAKTLFEEDKKRIESQLKKDAEIQKQEIVTLTKLDSDQKQAQLRLDFEKQTIEITKKHNEELTTLKIKLEADYYEKLKAALKTLHEEGNASTKFMQELALNMMKQGPVPTSLQIGMNTETTKSKM